MPSGRAASSHTLALGPYQARLNMGLTYQSPVLNVTAASTAMATSKSPSVRTRFSHQQPVVLLGHAVEQVMDEFASTLKGAATFSVVGGSVAPASPLASSIVARSVARSWRRGTYPARDFDSAPVTASQPPLASRPALTPNPIAATIEPST